jgi:hypothetical protein
MHGNMNVKFIRLSATNRCASGRSCDRPTGARFSVALSVLEQSSRCSACFSCDLSKIICKIALQRRDPHKFIKYRHNLAPKVHNLTQFKIQPQCLYSFLYCALGRSTYHHLIFFSSQGCILSRAFLYQKDEWIISGKFQSRHFLLSPCNNKRSDWFPSLFHRAFSLTVFNGSNQCTIST